MLRPHVVQVVGLVPVLALADAALELLPAGVRDEVPFQIAPVVKLALTIGASELPLAKMDSQVALQGRL